MPLTMSAEDIHSLFTECSSFQEHYPFNPSDFVFILRPELGAEFNLIDLFVQLLENDHIAPKVLYPRLWYSLAQLFDTTEVALKNDCFTFGCLER
jgi:hypothetical protein